MNVVLAFFWRSYQCDMHLNEGKVDVIEKMLGHCEPLGDLPDNVMDYWEHRKYGAWVYGYKKGTEISVHNTLVRLIDLRAGKITFFSDPYRALEGYLLSALQRRGKLSREVAHDVRSMPNVFDCELPPVYYQNNILSEDARVKWNVDGVYGPVGIDASPALVKTVTTHFFLDVG